MRKLLFVFLCLLPMTAAADVRPGFLAKYINSHQPMGHATLRKFFVRVYDANIWADVDSITYKDPFALSLTYDVTIDNHDFVDRTIKEMAQVSGVKPNELENKYREDLMRVFRNVKPGDTITALYLPKESVKFYFNDEHTGEIADKAFAERFFGIWLSPKTSEPDFRQALLNMPGEQ
ncbi:MAG: chalcone isomerase family protein [Rickettsiales bacterium]|nr:chalcone isomerase family protein [Rickettsiales bacterium]